MTEQQTLTKRKKLGYALGLAADSLVYNMYYTYFLTFLVQIVHIKPNLAGVVIFISIGWDAVTDPIIGTISDRPGADKRKLMLKSLLPLAVCFTVAWSGAGNALFGSSQALNMVFYTLVSMLIWLFYTMYTIPYYAVTAELTENYDERTQIRANSSLVNAFCVGVGNIMPALVGVGAITYFHIAGGISLLALAAGLVCTASLKGVYHAKVAKEGAPVPKGLGIGETVNSFRQIWQLRPVKFFLLFVFFFLAGSSMMQSNLSYMVVDCIDTDYNSGIAVVIGVLVLTMAITVPVVTAVSKKTDRRTACLIFISVAVVGLVLTKLIGLDTQIGGFKIMLVLTPLMLGVGISTFWTVFYSMAYDIVELDEYVNGNSGERRESVITALPQFVQKFGSAVGILAQGLILSAYGYNVSSETGADAATFVRPAESIVKGMENVSTVFPAAVMALALLCLLLYPITRKTYNALTEQLQKKRAGEKTSDAELQKLL